MNIKFEDDLGYQLEAIQSITDIFKGQESNNTIFTVEKSMGSQIKLGTAENELGIGNSLLLFPEEILKNLNEIQVKNGLPQTKKLKKDDYHFSVEMETGERVIIVTGCINALRSRVSGTLVNMIHALLRVIKYNYCKQCMRSKDVLALQY